MCGRFVSSANPADVAAYFDVERVEGVLPPRWNVAPTSMVWVVRDIGDESAAGDGGPQASSGGQVQRVMSPMHWGLVPSWSRDRSVATRMINARVETLADKPSFRRALRRRRCLIPADGFYEWHRHDSGTRLPWFFHRGDGAPLAMAGLWETWQSSSSPDDEVLESCTIITTEASGPVARVHHRMPVMVASGAWDQWLDPGLVDPGSPLELAGVDQDDDLIAYRVATEVNNARHEGPHLIVPTGDADGTDGSHK